VSQKDGCEEISGTGSPEKKGGELREESESGEDPPKNRRKKIRDEPGGGAKKIKKTYSRKKGRGKRQKKELN